MYFLLAGREFKKNLFMRIIIILQITIVFFCVVSISSIIGYFYNYYDNYKEYIDSKGILFNLQYIKDDEGILYESSDKVEDVLVKADVVGCYYPWSIFKDANENEIELESIAYDKELLEAYTPELSEGRWLRDNDDVIEAVVSYNAYGLKVGDSLKVYDTYMLQPEEAMTVKIVGVLEDGARITGFPEFSMNGMEDYEDIYSDVYSDEYDYESGGGKNPIILMGIDNINKCMAVCDNHSLERQMGGLCFVKYSDDITTEEIIENERLLGTYATYNAKEDLSVVRENSIENIKKRIFAILPIFICVFVLTIISATISCAISIKKQMRDFTIYGICGMNWNKSALISIIDCIYTAVIGMILCICVVCLNKKFLWFDKTMVDLGMWQAVSMFLAFALYVVISAIMPYMLIRGTSLSDELRRSWDD